MGPPETRWFSVWNTCWFSVPFQGNRYIDFHLPSHMWSRYGLLRDITSPCVAIHIKGADREVHKSIFPREEQVTKDKVSFAFPPLFSGLTFCAHGGLIYPDSVHTIYTKTLCKSSQLYLQTLFQIFLLLSFHAIFLVQVIIIAHVNYLNSLFFLPSCPLKSILHTSVWVILLTTRPYYTSA